MLPDFLEVALTAVLLTSVPTPAAWEAEVLTIHFHSSFLSL